MSVALPSDICILSAFRAILAVCSILSAWVIGVTCAYELEWGWGCAAAVDARVRAPAFWGLGGIIEALGQRRILPGLTGCVGLAWGDGRGYWWPLALIGLVVVLVGFLGELGTSCCVFSGRGPLYCLLILSLYIAIVGALHCDVALNSKPLFSGESAGELTDFWVVFCPVLLLKFLSSFTGVLYWGVLAVRWLVRFPVRLLAGICFVCGGKEWSQISGIKTRGREVSHYSEIKDTNCCRTELEKHGDRYYRSPSPHASVFKRLKKNRSHSPQPRPRKEGGVFTRLGRKDPVTSERYDSRRRSPQAKRTEVETRRHQQRQTPSRTTIQYSESEDSEGGHWKSRSRRQKSNTYEDDLYQPWTCVKEFLYTSDPALLSSEGLAFRENYLQQTKHIKDPVEIHHIKQRDGESTEDFMERYKGALIAEVLDVEGAPECMRISGFMHGITHPGLIKRLYERIPRSVDEMYRMTTSFLQGEVACTQSSPSKESNLRHEIFALEKGKFKAPPPMVTPVEKRDPSKYCEFHSDTGHNTNECMQLRKQIDEMIKAPSTPRRGRKVAKPRITQSFSPETAMSFPPLSEEDGTESPMIIEVEMGGHFVHRGSNGSGHYSPVSDSAERTIWTLGQIALLVKIGHGKHKKNPELLPSTAHGMLKFLVEGGTVTLKSSRVIPLELAHRSTLTEKGEKNYGLAETKRGIFTSQQKKRGGTERNKAIQEEVEKLVDAGIMKEVHYHSWLSNPVMVKKYDGTWRMCVDFKDLNNACPKTLNPLPGNRLEGESSVGFPFNVSWMSDFQWTPEAEEAFKQMKKLIAELPTLTAPREREELIIYLAAAKEAISAVLMTDREEQ
ncbi:reverse transcriptase domain-containing protein [Tanacetum coccineum]|uniref:Reverse transcriptase domain-containing protein n=1 Tax=Tanacetum coccineum TaxID=301880 RepID=A0ABQ5GIB4_9ASTR